MHSHPTRRQFLATTAAGAALLSPAPAAMARGRLQKPTLLGIGVGGKGRTDLQQASQAGFDVIALVDVVDGRRLDSIENRRVKAIAEGRDAYPQAKFGSDYREMIADMGDKIDAVMVSTPDHHHFHASLLAMQAGKHVYCQKPLTHGIWEARTLAAVAEQTGLHTQMGNQAHANDHLRRCVELVRAGIVGPVKEIHAWTNRPIWPQGFSSPPAPEPVPAGIDWNQWIGPAPWTDYSSLIAPFAWRGWWNYGTGALGDMACHIMDMGYWAMQAGAPQSVQATQKGATELSPPINSEIVWTFGPGPYSSREGFKFLWYDGYVDANFDRQSWNLRKQGNAYNHPGDDVLEGMDFEKYGSVIVGEQGKLFFNRGSGWTLKTDDRVDHFQWPEESIPRAPGENNYREWYDAIQGDVDQCQSHFGLAGPMTETILLGVLAQRFPGEPLVWDSEKLSVRGRPELQPFIRREYRDGWQVSATV